MGSDRRLRSLKIRISNEVGRGQIRPPSRSWPEKARGVTAAGRDGGRIVRFFSTTTVLAPPPRVLMSTTLPRGLAALSAFCVSASSFRPRSDAAISSCWAGSSEMQDAASMASSMVGGSFLTRSFGTQSVLGARLAVACDRILSALCLISLMVGNGECSLWSRGGQTFCCIAQCAERMADGLISRKLASPADLFGVLAMFCLVSGHSQSVTIFALQYDNRPSSPRC